MKGVGGRRGHTFAERHKHACKNLVVGIFLRVARQEGLEMLP